MDQGREGFRREGHRVKRATTRLRELIARGPTLYVPGCYNAMSGRVLEAAGFEAIYMTGYGTSLSLTGLPDVGLTTMSEMVANARYIAQAVKVPLLADADTGFGNAVNVHHAVRRLLPIVLAVPLYDLIVVSIIRISRGKSPFVGDTNHFSHRLVAPLGKPRHQRFERFLVESFVKYLQRLVKLLRQAARVLQVFLVLKQQVRHATVFDHEAAAFEVVITEEAYAGGDRGSARRINFAAGVKSGTEVVGICAPLAAEQVAEVG